jgi:hypothetical protein
VPDRPFLPEDTPSIDPSLQTGGGTTSLPPPPGTEDQSIGQIAGDRKLYSIDGKLYLVWMVPVDSDGDGRYDDFVPISYLAKPSDLAAAGISATPDVTITGAEWQRMGGLQAGNLVDLDNPDEHPFEFFVDQMVENSVLFPWLLDPEIMALTGAAWLEGRALSEAELAGTDWWQSHSASERRWMVLSSTSPEEAQALLADNRIMVLEMLEQAGVNNAPESLINLLADSFTRGEWSNVKLNNQVGLLADPSKRGDFDEAVLNYFAEDTDLELDTTQARRDTVNDAALRWLGPKYGEWSDRQLDQWGGRLRNDPDAAQDLEEMLARQRLALFPEYQNAALTYDDIAAPWRAVVADAWGEVPDETDSFVTKIVRLNDAEAAEQLLRREGIGRGNSKVVSSLLRDTFAAMGGNQIVRTL